MLAIESIIRERVSDSSLRAEKSHTAESAAISKELLRTFLLKRVGTRRKKNERKPKAVHNYNAEKFMLLIRVLWRNFS